MGYEVTWMPENADPIANRVMGAILDDLRSTEPGP